jgi:hypothetical protein
MIIHKNDSKFHLAEKDGNSKIIGKKAVRAVYRQIWLWRMSKGGFQNFEFYSHSPN